MPEDRAEHGLSVSEPAAEARTTCVVCVADHVGVPTIERDRLADLARAAIAQIGRGGEVRVLIVGDAEMADAHVRFSGVEGTTDVLTFDLSEGATARGGALDVDILVCADEAGRQAAAHGHDRWRELLLYVLHGVLHCLGHDDHADEAFERMHAEEDRILTAIGVGPTFHASGGRG